MASRKSKSKQGNYFRPNVWGMIRDVWIASMNKGQFPLAIIAVVVLVMIIKMPPKDVSSLVNKVLNLFISRYLLGWFLFVFITMVLFIHAKYLRRTHTHELKRVTDERNNLQKELLRQRPSTSN